MNAPRPPLPQTSDDRFLVYLECGHVSHCRSAPEPGSWLSCFWEPDRGGCQTSRRVVRSVQCAGCPDCPRWVAPVKSWQQPALFDLAAAA